MHMLDDTLIAKWSFSRSRFRQNCLYPDKRNILTFVWKEWGMHNRTADDLAEKRTNNLQIKRLDYYTYSKTFGKIINRNLRRQLNGMQNLHPPGM